MQFQLTLPESLEIDAVCTLPCLYDVVLLQFARVLNHLQQKCAESEQNKLLRNGRQTYSFFDAESDGTLTLVEFTINFKKRCNV